MSRKTLTEKMLILIDGIIKEYGAFAFPYKGAGHHFKKYKGSLSKALYELRHRGYLEEIEINNTKALRLTGKAKLKIISIDRKIKWDGLWRLVAFDIEETKKKTRDIFRDKLKSLGFKQIQKSLWINPFDISEQIEELIDLLYLHDNVRYFVTKIITNDDEYLDLFGLEKR